MLQCYYSQGIRPQASAADKCPCACSVEFLLAAGPAEALRPLGAVASGGETARVMMALKAAPASVLADTEHGSAGKLLVVPQNLGSACCQPKSL